LYPSSSTTYQPLSEVRSKIASSDIGSSGEAMPCGLPPLAPCVAECGAASSLSASGALSCATACCLALRDRRMC